MPHKKKKAFLRNQQRSAEDFYENPPSLPVTTKKSTSDNDTPKGFLRLVNRKSRKELISEGKLQVKEQKTPRIQPGESLSDFRRRVDTEIPLRMGGRMNQEVPIKKKKTKSKNKQEDDDIEGEERKRKRIRKGKKGKRSVSPDPYAHLAKDVPFNQPVQAPPNLTTLNRTTKSSLPNTLSAARKAILESERLDIIAQYRRRMQGNLEERS